MEESQEAVRQVFNQFDKDGNGFLELEELAKVAKELGKEISNYELKKIIKKIDTDKDGKVSFDEFFTWWHYGHENGLEDLVFLKMKGSKYINKAGLALGKIGGLLSDHSNVDTSEHFIGLNIGEAPPKSYLGARLFVGQEAQSLQEEQTKQFEDFKESTPGVIIKIRVKDAEAAKTEFQDIFEQILALAESLLPPEIADSYLSTLKINYSVPEENFIAIGITADHPLISQLLEQYVTLAQAQIPDNLLSSASLNLSFGSSIKDITANPTASFKDILSDSGLNLSFDLKVNKQILQKTRELFFKDLQKKIQKNKNYMAFDLQPLLPLFLIANSRVNLNFKSLDQAIKHSDLPIDQGPQNFEQALELFSEMGPDPKEMIGEIPIAEEVIELFKNHCCSDIQITVCAPKIAVQVYATTDGVQDLVSKILKDDE